MSKFILSLLTFLIINNSAFAKEQCKPLDSIGAQYNFSQVKQSDKAEFKPLLNLWRMPQQVAHENVITHITQLWVPVSNNKIELTRYFDNDKRAIEYQPDEVKVSNVPELWIKKQYLINPTKLSKMNLVKTEGTGCNQVDTYETVSDKIIIKIEWMSGYKLLKSSLVISNGIKNQWQLTKIIKDQTIVMNAFSTRHKYKSTDYADIGDNESDPFLNKMINLGHIEHHESGFYDSEGHALETNHSHH